MKEEIRAFFGDASARAVADGRNSAERIAFIQVEVLTEIAAQLAELNATLSAVELGLQDIGLGIRARSEI